MVATCSVVGRHLYFHTKRGKSGLAKEHLTSPGPDKHSRAPRNPILHQASREKIQASNADTASNQENPPVPRTRHLKSSTKRAKQIEDVARLPPGQRDRTAPSDLIEERNFPRRRIRVMNAKWTAQKWAVRLRGAAEHVHKLPRHASNREFRSLEEQSSGARSHVRVLDYPALSLPGP